MAARGGCDLDGVAHLYGSDPQFGFEVSQGGCPLLLGFTQCLPGVPDVGTVFESFHEHKIFDWDYRDEFLAGSRQDDASLPEATPWMISENFS